MHFPGVQAEAFQDDSSFMEVVEEGVKTSLLCVSNVFRAEKLTLMLRQLDFHVSPAPTSKLALTKLYHNSYDLVVLDESHDRTQGSESLVLQYLSPLPMHVRRQFFFCLVSETLPTLDHLAAYRMGVNMILNVQDLDKAKVILTRALKEYKSFYKVYTDELDKRGKL